MFKGGKGGFEGFISPYKTVCFIVNGGMPETING